MTNSFKLESLNFQRCRDGLFSNIVLSHLLIKNMISSSSTCKINAIFCILQKKYLKKLRKEDIWTNLNYEKTHFAGKNTELSENICAQQKRKTINTIKNTRASALDFQTTGTTFRQKRQQKVVHLVFDCCLCWRKNEGGCPLKAKC